MCRCRILDWKGLRAALGWSLSETAHRLGISRETVKAMQRTPHRCHHRAAERLMRAYLLDPTLRQRLTAHEYPDPFPEDRER